MDLENPANPFILFKDWFEEAKKSEADFPDAMSIATVDKKGKPSVRIVLMKDFSLEGFTFYTNLKSQKAQEILENPLVALNFHWKSLKKQIRISGVAKLVPDEISDQYFATRPRLSQIGAWASKQSQKMLDSYSLEKRVAIFTAKFGIGPVPRPNFWSGFCVVPNEIEFWHEKPFRLHQRILYQKRADQWSADSIFP